MNPVAARLSGQRSCTHSAMGARLRRASQMAGRACSSALTTLHDESNDARFKAIAALIAEWHPVALVVGLPTHLDGTEHELTARCRRFANQLHGRFGVPVFTADERLSSVAADADLAAAGRTDWRERKAVLDAVAARIILQTFLDTRRHERP